MEMYARYLCTYIFMLLYKCLDSLELRRGRELLPLQGLVALDSGTQLQDIKFVQSFTMEVKNLRQLGGRVFSVQIWELSPEPRLLEEEGSGDIQDVFTVRDFRYKLVWQKSMSSDMFLYDDGRYGIKLDPDEEFHGLHEDHRLGIHSEADVNPILFNVSARHEMHFSKIKYNKPFEVGDVMYIGDWIPFPYYFSVNLCNHTGCEKYPYEPPASTLHTPQRQVNTKPPTIAAPTQLEKETSDLLTDSFLVGVLLWLVVLSFLIFLYVCIFCFVKMRNKEDDTFAALGDEEGGDFFIMVDDSRRQEGLELEDTLPPNKR